MAKKKKKSKSKSSSSAAAAAAGASARPGAAQEFPHDAFDAAFRRYVHPAAVADLNRLAPGGPDWKRFLEAFGNSIFDLSAQIHQTQACQPSFDQEQRFMEMLGIRLDMNCPIASAIRRWKGEQGLSALKFPSVYRTIIHGAMPSYGRPLPTKANYLLEHEAQMLKMLEFDMHSGSNDIVLRTTSSSNRKEVSLSTRRVDWINFTQINVKDLVLYDSHEGKYIEGKLIVDPVTPRTGTNTLLEDSNGDVILVIVYNILPDGLRGRASIPFASTKVPSGATIRIVEPFFKIFQDGSRGIRIDNPSDISIVSSVKYEGAAVDKNEEEALHNANNSGNTLVKGKKYNAACEAYIAGIRQANVVPTLLSNRSQAYAMMNEWDRSLADAAASLTMRPENAKTWARYNKALEILSEQHNNDRRNMLTSLLQLESDNHAPESETSGKDASALKDAGNVAFKNKQYDIAAEFYTSALVMHGETSRALLANWALCCIRINANLDAMSASLASLRIRHEHKAVTRLAKSLLHLGEVELCQTVLTSLTCDDIIGNGDTKERREILKGVQFALEPNDSLGMLPIYLPSWIGPIEAFYAGSKKGRGIRAIEDIRTGQLLLIEPPLARSERDGKKEMFLNFETTNRIKHHSQVSLCHEILLRSQRECVLSRIVDCLSDGVNQRGVTSLQELIPNLASCKLLLPTHYDYMKEEDKLELTADRIDAILNVNSFGDGGVIGHSSTRLVPATSLFNHSTKNPTCACTSSKGGCSVTFAVKDVKAGDELAICYHTDKEAIQKHWGIHD